VQPTQRGVLAPNGLARGELRRVRDVRVDLTLEVRIRRDEHRRAHHAHERDANAAPSNRGRVRLDDGRRLDARPPRPPHALIEGDVIADEIGKRREDLRDADPHEQVRELRGLQREHRVGHRARDVVGDGGREDDQLRDAGVAERTEELRFARPEQRDELEPHRDAEHGHDRTRDGHGLRGGDPRQEPRGDDQECSPGREEEVASRTLGPGDDARPGDRGRRGGGHRAAVRCARAPEDSDPGAQGRGASSRMHRPGPATKRVRGSSCARWSLELGGTSASP
jgi:hypothetical protein